MLTGLDGLYVMVFIKDDMLPMVVVGADVLFRRGHLPTFIQDILIAECDLCLLRSQSTASIRDFCGMAGISARFEGVVSQKVLKNDSTFNVVMVSLGRLYRLEMLVMRFSVIDTITNR